MIAGLTIELILIISGVFLLGVLIGAAVKSVTHFFVPTDLLTILFYGLLCVDIVHNWIPINYNRLYDIPLFAGYFIGNVLYHIDSWYPVITNCRDKTMNVLPVAWYIPMDESGFCIQTQTNRALFKRLILRIHHRVGADASIPNDWIIVTKKPWYPKIRSRGFWTEKINIDQEEVKVLHFFRAIKFTTGYKLANASKIDKAEWLVDSKNYFVIQEKYDNLWLEYQDFIQTNKSDTIETAGRMLKNAIDVSPAQAVRKILHKWPKPVLELEDSGEYQLNEVQRISTEPQLDNPSKTKEELENKDKSTEEELNDKQKKEREASNDDEDKEED